MEDASDRISKCYHILLIHFELRGCPGPWRIGQFYNSDVRIHQSQGLRPGNSNSIIEPDTTLGFQLRTISYRRQSCGLSNYILLPEMADACCLAPWPRSGRHRPPDREGPGQQSRVVGHCATLMRFSSVLTYIAADA